MKIKCLLLGIVLAWGLIPASSVFAVDVQDFYFADFTADYYLTKVEDGTSNLHVKEVLTAVFPETDQNHGITRSIPTTNQGGKNKVIQDKTSLNLTVLRNGEPEKVSKIEYNNDYYLVYIGNASEYVHGEQVYTLEYDYTDVITEFDENGTNVSGDNGLVGAFQELYWDTNGTAWSQRFEKVTARLHTPEDIHEKMNSQAWCYVGKYGAKGEGRCEILQTKDGFVFTAEDLAIAENLTFVTRFQPGTFDVVINKDYSLVWVLVLEVMGVVVILSWRLTVWRRDAKQNYDTYKGIFVAPQYQPPISNNIWVAEGEQLYVKKTKSSYVATLLELAVHKKVALKRVEDAEYDWVAILNVDPKELTKSQKQMMNILSGNGSYEKGDEIPIQKHKATTYLASCAEDYKRYAVNALEESEYLADQKKGKNWLVFIIFALGIIAVYFGVLYVEGTVEKYASAASDVLVGRDILPYLILIILLAFTLVVLIINKQIRKYKKYTEKGLKMARYLEGLELYIKMAEADRLKFLQSVKGADTSNAGIVKLYEKLLPWASLFGAEKSWAKELKKYYEMEDIDGVVNIDVLNGIAVSSMVRDINSSVTSSTSYSDGGGGGSSFSSGGGGGGFSGGGGGGGGGGGW